MTKKKSDMGTRQKKRNLKKFIRQNTTRTERRQAQTSFRRGSRSRGEKTSQSPLAGSCRVPTHVTTKIKKGIKLKKIRVDDYPPFFIFEDDE
jgi:hypothetical protein